MPDPYLDDVIAAQNAAILKNLENTQAEQLEFAVKRRTEEEEDRRNLIRTHRYADETEHGCLEGDEARARIAERQAEHFAELRIRQAEEQDAAEQLTPVQRTAAERAMLSPIEALKIVRGEPNIANALQQNFRTQCALLESRSKESAA